MNEYVQSEVITVNCCRGTEQKLQVTVSVVSEQSCPIIKRCPEQNCFEVVPKRGIADSNSQMTYRNYLLIAKAGGHWC